MSSEQRPAATAVRPYRKRRRAEAEAETRQRITEAAVKLHRTVGPARTTWSGIAEEAGVQRATVYRHFPDLATLFDACSSHYMGLNPLPDPAPWTEIADPQLRLRRALTELYAWFTRTEDMTGHVLRDIALMPPIRATARFMAYFEQLGELLVAGRREHGRARARVAAAIGHALAFSTWQSLVREQGLDDEDAVGLMLGMVAAAGGRRSS